MFDQTDAPYRRVTDRRATPGARCPRQPARLRSTASAAHTARSTPGETPIPRPPERDRPTDGDRSQPGSLGGSPCGGSLAEKPHVDGLRRLTHRGRSDGDRKGSDSVPPLVDRDQGPSLQVAFEVRKNVFQQSRGSGEIQPLQAEMNHRRAHQSRRGDQPREVRIQRHNTARFSCRKRQDFGIRRARHRYLTDVQRIPAGCRECRCSSPGQALVEQEPDHAAENSGGRSNRKRSSRTTAANRSTSCTTPGVSSG